MDEWSLAKTMADVGERANEPKDHQSGGGSWLWMVVAATKKSWNSAALAASAPAWRVGIDDGRLLRVCGVGYAEE